LKLYGSGRTSVVNVPSAWRAFNETKDVAYG
jgi:hypothetical protein